MWALFGRWLVTNNRVLCASPDYLKRRGVPRRLEGPGQHDCLVLKERDNAFGMWQLQGLEGEGWGEGLLTQAQPCLPRTMLCNTPSRLTQP